MFAAERRTRVKPCERNVSAPTLTTGDKRRGVCSCTPSNFDRRGIRKAESKGKERVYVSSRRSRRRLESRIGGSRQRRRRSRLNCAVGSRDGTPAELRRRIRRGYVAIGAFSTVGIDPKRMVQLDQFEKYDRGGSIPAPDTEEGRPIRVDPAVSGESAPSWMGYGGEMTASR